jgi:hypothetical protein
MSHCPKEKPTLKDSAAGGRRRGSAFHGTPVNNVAVARFLANQGHNNHTHPRCSRGQQR